MGTFSRPRRFDRAPRPGHPPLSLARWEIGGGKKTPRISRRSFCHHTIFRDTIFPDARGRGRNSKGAKTTPHFQMELFQMPADVVGNRNPTRQEYAGRMSG